LILQVKERELDFRGGVAKVKFAIAEAEFNKWLNNADFSSCGEFKTISRLCQLIAILEGGLDGEGGEKAKSVVTRFSLFCA